MMYALHETACRHAHIHDTACRHAGKSAPVAAVRAASIHTFFTFFKKYFAKPLDSTADR